MSKDAKTVSGSYEAGLTGASEKVAEFHEPESALKKLQHWLHQTPSAVPMMPELAAAADFLSIGSNDFIQYLLAVDRTNDEVANWFMPHHPAVLRSLNAIVQAALSAGGAAPRVAVRAGS